MSAPLFMVRSTPAEAPSGHSVLVVKETQGKGRGAFAARPIRAGETVHPVTGLKVHRTVMETDTEDNFYLQVDEDWFMMETGGADDYINHSCEPNLGFSDNGKNFIALRDIQAGEELNFDYGMSENDTGWSVKCLCAAPSCRGNITGFPDLPPDAQKRILPHAMPHIRRKNGL